MRLTMAEAMKQAVEAPRPEYSPLARQMKVSGDVEVELRINDRGTVDEVKVISGNPLLTQPVLKTVKEWKFTPFKQDGEPAAVVTNLKFAFKL